MRCYSCYDKRVVVEPSTGRPLPCPECQGMALSCCEGTDRELEHQKVELPKVLPIPPSGRAFDSREDPWHIFRLPSRPMRVSSYITDSLCA